jgi:glycosyltransferase involved in cell wall biosynthesis
MKVALVVPGGFDRPNAQGTPRRIPALNALVARLATEHEVHVCCTDFDERGGTWPLLGATVHDPGRVPPRTLPLARMGERAIRLLRVLRLASKRVRFDIVHAFWVDGNGAAAAIAARVLGVPLIASVGGGECVWIPDIRYGNAKTARARLATRTVLAAARVVTIGSRRARDAVPRADVEVVPLGAERAVFEADVERTPGPPWSLVHIADRNVVKDPWTLLEALRELVARGIDVTLDWLGCDTLRGAVETQARALGIDRRIVFRGEVPHSEVARALRSAHLHVLSSRYESQSVAVLEAALAGVATVGSRVGILADLAPAAALAVPPRDAGALADAIASLLVDAGRRHAVARAAQQYACAHDARWTVSAFTSLYRLASNVEVGVRKSSFSR